MAIEIKKAVKSQVKLKLALTGPSGSGKTYSALALAKGLGDKVLVVDTENGSASLYSDKFNFDVIELKPPYTTEMYREALALAVANKYDIVILDSISHAWSGEGGLLQQKEALDGTGKGNSYVNWGAITKKQESFIADILHSDINLIATMRSKMDYAIENNNGKTVIKKVGLAPVQRDGVEYEFTSVLDMDMTHNAAASKDRTGLFPQGYVFQPTIEVGKKILAWLKGGVEVKPAVKPAAEAKAAPVSKPAASGDKAPELTPDEVKVFNELYDMLNQAEKNVLTRDFGLAKKKDYYDKVPYATVKFMLDAKKREIAAKAAEENPLFNQDGGDDDK